MALKGAGYCCSAEMDHDELRKPLSLGHLLLHITQQKGGQVIADHFVITIVYYIAHSNLPIS